MPPKKRQPEQSLTDILQELEDQNTTATILEYMHKIDQQIRNRNTSTIPGSGDVIIRKTMEIFQDQLNPDQQNVCKSIVSHSLALTSFCQQFTVKDLYDFVVLQLFHRNKEQTALSMLIDLLMKIYAHRFDPRRDGSDKITDPADNKTYKLIDLFQYINRLYAESPERHGEQCMLMLNALNHESVFVCQTYFRFYFDSEVSILLRPDGFHGQWKLRVLTLALRSSGGVFRLAVSGSGTTVSHYQGRCLNFVFEYLVANGATAEQLGAYFEAISMPNLKIDYVPLLHSSFKVAFMDGARRNLSAMNQFNRFRFGPYFGRLLSQFFDDVGDAIETLDNYSAVQNKGKFSGFQVTEEEFDTAVNLVGVLLGLIPALPAFYQLNPTGQFSRKLHLDKLEELLKSGKLTNQAVLYQQWQYGINLCLGVLSKTPDIETANLQFLLYIFELENSELTKKPSSSFLIRVLNDYYEQYIADYLSKQEEFGKLQYQMVFHVPVQLFEQLDVVLFAQLFQHVFRGAEQVSQRIGKLEQDEQYDEARPLYALQKLAQVSEFLENEVCITQTEKLVESIIISNLPANVKKPALQIAGVLAKSQKISASLFSKVQTVMAYKNRAFDTALRVAGLVLQFNLTPELSLLGQDELLEVVIDKCYYALCQKDFVAFGGLVVIGEFYETISKLGVQASPRLQQIQMNIKRYVFEKLSDLLNLYPHAVGNFQRKQQLLKLLNQTLKMLSQTPDILVDVGFFNNVVMYYTQYTEVCQIYHFDLTLFLLRQVNLKIGNAKLRKDLSIFVTDKLEHIQDDLHRLEVLKNQFGDDSRDEEIEQLQELEKLLLSGMWRLNEK